MPTGAIGNTYTNAPPPLTDEELAALAAAQQAGAGLGYQPGGGDPYAVYQAEQSAAPAPVPAAQPAGYRPPDAYETAPYTPPTPAYSPESSAYQPPPTSPSTGGGASTYYGGNAGLTNYSGNNQEVATSYPATGAPSGFRSTQGSGMLAQPPPTGGMKAQLPEPSGGSRQQGLLANYYDEAANHARGMKLPPPKQRKVTIEEHKEQARRGALRGIGYTPNALSLPQTPYTMPLGARPDPLSPQPSFANPPPLQFASPDTSFMGQAINGIYGGDPNAPAAASSSPYNNAGSVPGGLGGIRQPSPAESSLSRQRYLESQPIPGDTAAFDGLGGAVAGAKDWLGAIPDPLGGVDPVQSGAEALWGGIRQIPRPRPTPDLFGGMKDWIASDPVGNAMGAGGVVGVAGGALSGAASGLDYAADRFIQDDAGEWGMLPTSLDRLADTFVQDDAGKKGVLGRFLTGNDETQAQKIEPRGLVTGGVGAQEASPPASGNWSPTDTMRPPRSDFSGRDGPYVPPAGLDVPLPGEGVSSFEGRDSSALGRGAAAMQKTGEVGANGEFTESGWRQLADIGAIDTVTGAWLPAAAQMGLISEGAVGKTGALWLEAPGSKPATSPTSSTEAAGQPFDPNAILPVTAAEVIAVEGGGSGGSGGGYSGRSSDGGGYSGRSSGGGGYSSGGSRGSFGGFPDGFPFTSGGDDDWESFLEDFDRDGDMDEADERKAKKKASMAKRTRRGKRGGKQSGVPSFPDSPIRNNTLDAIAKSKGKK